MYLCFVHRVIEKAKPLLHCAATPAEERRKIFI